MANLYLLHNYNNYYNRIVKKENSLADYSAFLIDQAPVIQNFNFVVGDGVNTQIKVNWNYYQPDYVVVANGSVIESRWFVLECKLNRAGQYIIDLKRDVVVDYYDSIVNAPCFIEKATLNDSNNLIFNQESDSFNQIKTSETLLMDNTKCPWIIGYLSSKDITDVGLSIDVRRGQSSADIIVSSKNDYWSRYAGLQRGNALVDTDITHYISGSMDYFVEIDAILEGGGTGGSVYQYRYIVNENGVTDYTMKSISKTTETATTYSTVKTGKITDCRNYLRNALNSTQRDEFVSTMSSFLRRNSATSLSNIMEDNGKIVYVSGENKVYSINITRMEDNSLYRLSDVNIDSSRGVVYNEYTDLLTHTFNNMTAPTQGASAQCFKLNYGKDVGSSGPSYYWFYRIELRETSITTDYELTIPAATVRVHLKDAPYDMFCMPYMDDCKFYNNGTVVTSTYPYGKDVAINAANAMSAQWSGVGFLYDIQLLPYCPLGEESLVFDSSGNFLGIEVSGLTKGTIKLDNEIIGYVPFLAWSEFTEDIDYSIDIDNVKVQNQTDSWRLCSPSYGAIFEFNAAKNGGVSLFNVDCQYKPFTPYIHVNPVFNRLYGSDFNDTRGLICNPDFSLPMITDQFATYEYQNKNYQNMFDRQILNMSTNHRYNQIEQLASGVAGAGTGAASGAFAGSMLGATGLGAGLGMLTSAGGAIADLLINQGRYEESKSYATSTFNMQLDNIKALPNTLTKVSSFNNNNKLFPVLEYYTCTNEEREAFENKLYYNGMSVNVIGKISDYLQDEISFIKGKLIRLENISDDFHVATDIANEISQGVFI